MFFATFCSTVALGVVIQKQTHNMIGVEEYLIMNSIAGMVHALFGCQPLLVLRPTGPITAIIGKIYQLALVCNLDFWQYLAATGYFVGFYMFIVAAFELSRWIKYLTRFTHEIFNFFVCSIYVHDGITGVLDRFTSGEGGERKQKAKLGVSIFSTLIAIITFIVALWLNSAHTWRVGTFTIRKVLRDYAVTIAVLVSVGVSYIFELYDTAVERIALPLVPGPTCVHARNPANSTTWSVWPPVGMEDASCAEGDWDCFCLGADVDAASTSVGRPWFISFANAPLKLWPIAAATALPIVFFFFMDQNTSSLLCQKPYMFLKKGSCVKSRMRAARALQVPCDSRGASLEASLEGRRSLLFTPAPTRAPALLLRALRARGRPLITGTTTARFSRWGSSTSFRPPSGFPSSRAPSLTLRSSSAHSPT
jgi:hypothetical protein